MFKHTHTHAITHTHTYGRLSTSFDTYPCTIPSFFVLENILTNTVDRGEREIMRERESERARERERERERESMCEKSR